MENSGMIEVVTKEGAKIPVVNNVDSWMTTTTSNIEALNVVDDPQIDGYVKRKSKEVLFQITVAQSLGEYLAENPKLGFQLIVDAEGNPVKSKVEKLRSKVEKLEEDIKSKIGKMTNSELIAQLLKQNVMEKEDEFAEQTQVIRDIIENENSDLLKLKIDQEISIYRVINTAVSGDSGPSQQKSLNRSKEIVTRLSEFASTKLIQKLDLGDIYETISDQRAAPTKKS